MKFDDKNFDDGSEYELPFEDLKKEAELTIIEKEKIKILSAMEEFIKKTKENIEYKEKSEERKNTDIIFFYSSSIRKLEELEKADIAENELFEVIEELDKSVNEMSYFDIDKLLSEKEIKNEKILENGTNNEEDISSSFDI